MKKFEMMVHWIEEKVSSGICVLLWLLCISPFGIMLAIAVVGVVIMCGVSRLF